MIKVKIDKQTLKTMVLKNKDLTTVDYSHIEDMSFLFADCQQISSIPPIDMSNVKTVQNMYRGCNNLKKIGSLNMPKVKNANDMFKLCVSLEEVEEIIAPKAIDISAMFAECFELKKVGTIQAPNAEDMMGLFHLCKKLTSIRQIDTSSAITMSYMLNKCDVLKIEELNWDFSKVLNFYGFTQESENFIKLLGEEETIKFLKRIKVCDDLKEQAIKKAPNNKAQEYLNKLVQENVLTSSKR